MQHATPSRIRHTLWYLSGVDDRPQNQKGHIDIHPLSGSETAAMNSIGSEKYFP